MELSIGGASLAVACSSWSFACLPLDKSMRVVRSLGFSHIDIGFVHLDLSGPGSPRQQGGRLRTKLETEELAATDLFPLLPYETNDPDPAHREENSRMFHRVVEYAEGCQAHGITLKPGIAQPSMPDGGWQASVEILKELAATAAERALRLSVEPHVGSLVEDPQSARRLVEGVPGIGITLDYSHFVSRGLEVGDVAPLHPYVRHLHLRQAQRGRLQTAAQNGVIPFRRILEQLVSHGYRGAICLEYQHTEWHDCNDIDVISETIATLRDLGLRV